MRLPRFETYLKDLLTGDASPSITSVQTFAEADYAKRPHGFRLQFASGGQAYLQLVRTSPSDGSDQRPEEPIVEGEPPTPIEPRPLPDGGGQVRTRDLEQYIKALITNSGSTELKDTEGYSEAPAESGQTYGVRVFFHSGAAIYILFVHTLRSGQGPSADTEFKVLEAV
ncbi:hypothetical protein HDA32_005693 [Spinactinospora alkalitolerans]|uniref:Uncharacterized protein n=1 Tax=Spinactinospora alkalitolerans TaxID=687207 RepID=A0A852U6S7_9ACTN|nr:hypothetical protein [Spinactinospora alkalitolerans]NYE50573.1 hypothetical protein [Spinactinospora alkalitolerans]